VTAKKLLKAQVSKKRTVHTYAELWRGSRVLLERAQAEPKGSKWLWMGSLFLTAFSFEAYLNHIGPKVFECWDTLEVLSPESKLDVICEKLGINLARGERPRKTIHELIKFRNNLAHGKTVTVEENTIRDVDQYLDEFLGIRPLAVWEKYCTEENAIRAREDIEKVLRLIHDKVNPENDWLFFSGFTVHSASIQEVP
jgi:hypothetical protein